MKTRVPIFLLLAGIFAGCVSQKNDFSPAQKSSVPLSAIVTPDISLAGKVISYNSGARFVVLNFPGGQLPSLDQKLFLYRNGLKVAEVKITGPQNDDNIVADVLVGAAQSGDDARDQ